MMEDITPRPNVEYIPPPLPPKVRQKKITSGSTTFTQITANDGSAKLNLIGYGSASDDLPAADIDATAIGRASLSSMHSLVLNSTAPSATVFVAAGHAAERDTSIASADAAGTRSPPDANKGRNHVVTIRVNTSTSTDNQSTVPIISSVHLKSQEPILNGCQSFGEICSKKNNSLVRITADEKSHLVENEDSQTRTAHLERTVPYIYCNPYSLNTVTNMVMSSGQCSPSDTLDSGTCSDLDGTPPPLPKKKLSKTNGCSLKKISVTMISSANSTTSNHSEVDFEDNDSNISCDSLNSSELNGSVHTDESHQADQNKKDKNTEPPAAPEMPAFLTSKANNNDSSFLPQGLLQDIRDRSAKLNMVSTESEDMNTANSWHDLNGKVNLNVNENGNLTKESTLTSFRLVSEISTERTSPKISAVETKPLPNLNNSKISIVSESTYEDRQIQNKLKQEKMCYRGNVVFDTDKYYDFHLNEKQFEDNHSFNSVSVVKSDKNVDSVEFNSLEYFAGIKDYKNEEVPSTIRSSKGTIRGVKNRVRAGIATFLQMHTTTKSYKEKDAGKVVLYTTTMGIVRSTYQRCVLVKKILRNLLIKYEERDVFMSTEYQDEIRDRMRSDDILVPQLFIDGQHVGDADTVEKLNEGGELRKMLKPYKSPDACNTCQVCGGFRLLPCRVCSGSKKSLHRNHFTAEFVALKCMNCDEVGLVKCEACSS